MPRPRRPSLASPDQVRITRDGDDAVIEYADPNIAQTHFKLGREKLATMTDADVLAVWNEHIQARDRFMAEYEHVAVEIPMGRPQLKYEERSDQWCPRGDVVKGVICDGSDLDEEFVTIDDRDLTLRQFARMVMTFGGWGFRLTFVPDDEIHDEPTLEVREPTPNDEK